MVKRTTHTSNKVTEKLKEVVFFKKYRNIREVELLWRNLFN